MNKYQEALDYIKSIEVCPEECIYVADFDEVNILQELVDKETPIKTSGVETEPGAYYGMCESCGSGIRLGKHYDNEKEKWIKECYCLHCGQKLDWSSEDA